MCIDINIYYSNNNIDIIYSYNVYKKLLRILIFHMNLAMHCGEVLFFYVFTMFFRGHSLSDPFFPRHGGHQRRTEDVGGPR